MNEDEITGEMPVENLIRILRTQSIALVGHEAHIRALRERVEELTQRVNLQSANIDAIAEGLNKLLSAIPRAGRGPETTN